MPNLTFEVENSLFNFQGVNQFDDILSKMKSLDGNNFQIREFKKYYFYSRLQFDQFEKVHNENFDSYFFSKNQELTSEQKKSIYTMQSCIAPIYLYLSKSIRYVIDKDNDIHDDELKYLNRIIETRNKLIEHNHNPYKLNLRIELDEYTSIGSNKEVHCDILDIDNEENYIFGYLYPKYDFERASKIIDTFIDKLIQ